MAVVPLGLGLAACGDDDGDETSTGQSGEDGGDGGGDDLSLDIVSPAEGDPVGESFDLEIDSSVDLGEPDTGLHHVHVFYDGNEDDGEYDLVYEESFTVERQLGEGEHTVRAVLANADHSLTDASDEVTVTVGGAGGGSGGSVTTGGSDSTGTTEGDDGGYDY